MNDPSGHPMSFEQALDGLERIVKELEEGKIGLEESLTLYENGVGLIRRCQEQCAGRNNASSSSRVWTRKATRW